MFWRSQTPDLAEMLTHTLEQLKKTVCDPQVGVDALVDFYKCDAEIFERCDDSYSNIGDVCRAAWQGIVKVLFARSAISAQT